MRLDVNGEEVDATWEDAGLGDVPGRFPTEADMRRVLGWATDDEKLTVVTTVIAASGLGTLTLTNDGRIEWTYSR